MRGRAVWIGVVAIAALAAIAWWHHGRTGSPSVGPASTPVRSPPVHARVRVTRPVSDAGRGAASVDGAGIAGAIVAAGTIVHDTVNDFSRGPIAGALILIDARGSLSGHVTSGGAPAAPFQISCSGPSGLVRTTVDAPDGAYAFDNLAPGEYDCSATSDSSIAIDRIDVPGGPITHDFTLAALGSLTGRLINAATDTPVENAEVRLEYGADRSIRGDGRTDALGNFALGSVPAGSGAVMIIVGDPGRRIEQPFAMPAGGQLDLGTLLLR